MGSGETQDLIKNKINLLICPTSNSSMVNGDSRSSSNSVENGVLKFSITSEVSFANAREAKSTNTMSSTATSTTN